MKGLFKMKKVAILVVSCDKYSDTWEPFFTLLLKYWKECPYLIYLGTNEKDFYHEKVKVIKIGSDKGWTESIVKMLDVIDSDYVLMALDDFLFGDYTDNAKVCEYIEFAVKENIGCLRMVPNPCPTKKI